MINYNDVIEHLDKEKRNRHLLLGNGFSMAYDNKIFSYNALSGYVESTNNALLNQLFKALGTTNFEQIMRQLSVSKDIIAAVGGDENMVTKLDSAMQEMKDALIKAIEVLHPEHVYTIPDDKCESCSTFLKGILDKNGKVFSTNYDVLLYWVLMRNHINAIDGFGRDVIQNGSCSSEDATWSELRWGNNKNNQNIYYLHGALPIFDTGIDIIKEQYDGDYLVENVRRRMNNGQYPVFVTAGDGKEKLENIMHNHYLSYCYDALCGIDGSLITFGFNFGEYDDHIIDAINKASRQSKDRRLWSIYIGAYSEYDVQHIESIRDKFSCKVNIFDSKTANIWG